MKNLRFIFTFVLVWMSATLFAQIEYATTVNGVPLKANNENLTGSVLEFPNWQLATVVYKDATKTANVKVNIDQVNNQSLFLGKNQTALAFVNQPKLIILKDSITSENIVFQNGFKGFQGSESIYFKVLIDKGIVLLKRNHKTINQKNNYNSSNSSSYIQNTIEYYFIDDQNTLQKLPSSNSKIRKLLLSVFPVQLGAYLSENKANLSLEKELILVFQHLNGIN